MKKWILLLIIVLSPLMVVAKTTTEEDVMTFIKDIQNIQVDDNVVIEKTTVTEREIILEVKENNKIEEKHISYNWNNYILTFLGGTISKGQEPNDNQYAFYLYAILENKTTCPYEENHYYNQSLIKKIVENHSEKEIKDYNTGNTFSLLLTEKEPNLYQIAYQYNLAGDDASLITTEDFNQEEILKNPNTGNIHFYVTILLIIMLGITAYTYWGKDPIEKGV